MISTKLETGEVLTFEDISHTYTINDDPCSGTSDLLERHEISKPITTFSAPYVQRGTRIDLATCLDDEGDLDESSVDSTEIGYIEAWRKFKRDHDVKILEIQKLVGSAHYWYATTIDRICAIDGVLCTLNQKTGNFYKSNVIQCHLEGLLYPEAEKVQAVYIAADGTYDLQDFTDDDMARKTASAIAQTNGMVHCWNKKRRKTKATVGA